MIKTPEYKGLETINELRAMRAKIDQAISALESVYGPQDDTYVTELRAAVREKPDYSRMSLRAGALDAVSHADQPLSTNDVVALLMDGGLRTKAKSVSRTVYTTLYGLAKQPDAQIELTADRKWEKK